MAQQKAQDRHIDNLPFFFEGIVGGFMNLENVQGYFEDNFIALGYMFYSLFFSPSPDKFVITKTIWTPVTHLLSQGSVK